MNLKQVISGVVSGYVAKGLQLAVSLLVVPYLLREDILGVEDYGRAFAILGVSTSIGVSTIGVMYATDRAIAKAVGGDPLDEERPVSQLLGGGTKILTLVAFLILLPMVIFDTALLRLLDIPPESDYRGAILAAVSIVFFENSLYLLRAPLMARGDITFVNMVWMLETVLRTLAIVVTFTYSSPSITAFFVIQAIFTVARQMTFLFRLDRSDLDGFLGARMLDSIDTVRYSGSVTLTEGANIVLRNAPVALASGFLGPAEAGYVALVVNTIQRYLLQILVAVVQPIALPIASRFRISDASESRIRNFFEIESLYALVVLLSSGMLILWAPELIPLWLGSEFHVIVLPAQLMIAGCSFEICYMIRRSMLMGQGVLPDAVPAILGAAFVASALVAVGIVALDSWTVPVAICGGYLVVSNVLGIDRVFERYLIAPHSRRSFPRLLSAALIFGCSLLFGMQLSAGDWAVNLAWSAAALMVMVGISFLTIISPARIWMLSRRLYRLRDASLFD